MGIQLSLDRRVAQFAAPPFPNLYSAISSLGLQPIGVEFVHGGSFTGSDPPDWQCASPSNGFQILAEQRAWQDIRTAAYSDKKAALADFASRAKSYLSLLPIRIFQLSEAYNRMLRLAGSIKAEHLFDNVWRPHLEAAVHAYLADAASFRDLIAEGVWRFLLGGDTTVTTLGSFLKRAKDSPNTLAQDIISAGKPGGWIKIFTDLRNDVIHVAPVGRSQALHFCQAREVQLGSGKILTMHYPLLASDGTIYLANEAGLDFEDEGRVRERIDEFRTYCESSIDGLTYAWETTARFVELLSSLRRLAGFRQEGTTITDADIIGEVKITR
ncbi:MAG: hypothetical protein KA233_08615 [Novosphingobium sp.]|nr:hypothetical protein [Novosphingobium sp.]